MFITFEGGEGVGKSTQMALLSDYLEKKGLPIIITREPGGTSFAEDLRPLFFTHATDPLEELLLLLAARRHHVHTKILPALQEGQFVLCDRYIDSTLVYQGTQVDPDIILQWHRMADIHLWPDLTFILQDDPATSLMRKLGDTRNRFEERPLSFHQNVQASYQRIAKDNPDRCRIISVQHTLHQTAMLIQKELEAVLFHKKTVLDNNKTHP